jgi:SAM-dependent methyltransferase
MECGYDVTAIDVGSSIYKDHKVFPVIYYDGKVIPFPAESYDVIFTSNVIAHVADPHQFHKEIHRVLKHDGIAIHVVPSSVWRFWTNLTYYGALLRAIAKRINTMLYQREASCITASHIPNFINSHPNRSKTRSILKHVFPSALGVRGNAASELWEFSRWGWGGHFSRTGWTVEKRFGSSLFYTGYMVLGTSVSLHSREIMSKILGSSCHIFVLKKKGPADSD